MRGSQKVFYELGRQDVGYLDPGRSFTKASPIFSWYGAAGALLTVLSIVLVTREVRRRRLPLEAMALAAAPVVWVVLLGLGVPYWEWNGRYAIGGFALGAATWGLVLRFEPLAWATAMVVTLTALLSFIHLHDRPSGLRVLEPTNEPSVWNEPAWSVQATDHPHLRALYRFFEESVPADARVAVEPNVWPGGSAEGGILPVFPLFGRDLPNSSLRDLPGRRPGSWRRGALLRDRSGPCVSGWHVAFRTGLWHVLRRAPGAGCP